MYLEPCCLSKQLPKLLKQSVSHFQSNSDWTVNELLSELTSCVPNGEITLVMPNIDVLLLRTLASLLSSSSRLKSLRLLTQGNQTEEIRAHLSTYHDRVTISQDALIACRLVTICNEDRYVIIQGSLNLVRSNSYQAFTVTTTQDHWNECLETLNPKFTVGKREVKL